jgi:phosphatidylserine/phosphatidylglycerophosphate/cardiolipin synthase-like enzyme
VRFIFDKVFYAREPAIPDRLKAMEGIEVRILDMKGLTGGVQHAKFFVVDNKDAYVGSQNFDWRSLTHVQELGVRTSAPPLVAATVGVFELDWQLAAGATFEQARAKTVAPAPNVATELPYGDGRITVTPGFSPEGLILADDLWDLPRILALIDGAEKRVRVQVMSYEVSNYDGSTFTELDDALKRAAGRGVSVELMVADWSKKPYAIKHLQELQLVDNITVKLVTIPRWSGGFVPYARVIHSKLMTVDGSHGWVGTSNWSGDYFKKSRNLGFFLDGKLVTDDLDTFFERAWASSYAEVVDPNAQYEAPRVKE